eukprot:TRINITY_DN26760_c0_g1_i1.p2 TRINITY_DN26760_c0_g1~~TRINITY_DN26760_c0_g1_i1.p2  ORF type:complete len:116 (+),score=5.44 TRINITY_DN26760_c0_g1_i1:152-499(+)
MAQRSAGYGKVTQRYWAAAIGQRTGDWKWRRQALLQRLHAVDRAGRNSTGYAKWLNARVYKHISSGRFAYSNAVEESAKVFQCIQKLRAQLRREVMARAPTTCMPSMYGLADRFD